MKRLRKAFKISWLVQLALAFTLGAVFAVAVTEVRLQAFADERVEAEVADYTVRTQIAVREGQMEARRVAEARLAAVAQGAAPETQADRDATAAYWQNLMPTLDGGVQSADEDAGH